MLHLTTLLLIFLTHLSQCLALASSPSEADDSPPPFNEAVANGTYGYYPIRTFATNARVAAPRVNWATWSPECDDGLFYFITPRGWSIPRPGPMILNAKGEMIWSKHFSNEFGGQAYDFQVQTYKGEEFLTFWLGDDRIRGHGSGSYYMLNASYDIVHQVDAANGLTADLHEFLITPEGTALMSMYEIVRSPSDLSVFRKFKPEENEDDKEASWIWDCAFQEVDIGTGELVFEWRASEHVDISDTWHGIGGGGNRKDPFDWFHINSIEKDGSGNYLISARYTHSLTYVDGKSGDIIWTLGGRSNDFMDLSGGSATDFAWQHDARFMPEEAFEEVYTSPEKRAGYETRLISFFDNAAEDQHYEYGIAYSRGLLLEVTYPTTPQNKASHSTEEGLYPDVTKLKRNDDLNEAKIALINGTNPSYTVRVIKSYENPSLIRSSSQGNLQLLHHAPLTPLSTNPATPNVSPRALVGYGLNALLTEYHLNATVACDAHFGARTSWERGDIQSYRAYKFGWAGRPQYPPKVVLSADEAEVFVSWNGATDVEGWRLEGSADATDGWEEVHTLPWGGWETRLELSAWELVDKRRRFLRVVALDANSQILPHGVSEVVDRGLLVSYLPFVDRAIVVAEAQGGVSSILVKAGVWVGFWGGVGAVGFFGLKIGMRVLRGARRGRGVLLRWRPDRDQGLGRGLLGGEG